MIEVIVLYPAGEGRTFDMNYYLKTHIPLFQKRMGAVAKDLSVVKGIRGPTPGSPASFVAMAHYKCESMEAFANAFGQHAAELLDDIPKFTNIQAVVQVSEVIAV